MSTATVAPTRPQPELFAPLAHPYYIFTPEYLQTSGGVRALHYLCHALNLAGHEAYVTTTSVHPDLRTPILVEQQLEAHLRSGREPIVVYPEVVSGNPMEAQNVVRYLLAPDGLHTGVPIDLQPDDLVFTFYGPLLPEGWRGDVLTVPLVDTRIFNSAGVDPADRRGTAVWIHRHLDKGGQLHPLTADSTEISFRVPERNAHELAALLRGVECLYLYEHSALTFEALMCGCPVVFIPNEIEALPRDPAFMDGHGIAWTPDPDEIAQAKATVHLAAERYRRLEREFWSDLNRFVVTTQASARARQL